MKAVVVKELDNYSVESVTLDPPKEGEVMVCMKATGVCHSDLSVINGTLPLGLPTVIGHEGAGIVEQVGPGVSNLQAGDHVVLSFVPVCGQCQECQNHRPYFCTILDKAALIGCGVMTGVGSVINSARVHPGASVAVYGCGGVGLSVIQGARLAGAGRIIAVDLAENKLEMASKFGATDLINSGSKDPVAGILELTGGVDYAFEAVGIPRLMEQCYDSVRRGGTAVIVGVAPITEEMKINALMVSMSGKSLIGTLYGNANPAVDFPRLLNFYQRGKLNLDDMISRTYRIDEAPQAFEDMKNNLNARGVILYD